MTGGDVHVGGDGLLNPGGGGRATGRTGLHIWSLLLVCQTSVYVLQIGALFAARAATTATFATLLSLRAVLLFVA